MKMTTLFLKDKILNLMTYQWYLMNLGKKILDLIEKYLGQIFIVTIIRF